MAHYEERLQADLERIKTKLRQLGVGVQEALNKATASVLTRDAELATDTILGDLPINRRYREIDHLCHVFVARHFPSAGHLRFISAVLRLNKTLERIGDYAETISRAALQLADNPPPQISEDIRMMSQHAAKILGRSLRAFDEQNAELARGTLEFAGEYATTYDRVFADMIDEGERRTRPVPELFSLLAIFNRFERVIHQSKNICEQTLFVTTGATKLDKTFDILFVDDSNTGASLLAEHYSRKNFPGRGTYQSAGWSAGKAVDPVYVRYAVEKGLDLRQAIPRSFDAIKHAISDVDIIVDLSGNARSNIPKIPFHTLLLSWPLENRDQPDEVCQQLAPKLNGLMRRLRGDEEA
ncbi:MAG: PhoU domain-containing protein [Planctomycetota bacterium]